VATALTISASLAQIGEFSFILAELGVRLGLLPEQGRDLILAGALLSILLNPAAFAAVDWLRPYLERGQPAPAGAGGLADASGPLPAGAAAGAPSDVDAPLSPTTLTGHVVLVGYGRVGRLVGKSLQEAGTPFLVIEDADNVVAGLRENRIEAIAGNAATPAILGATNLARARHLVVAIPNTFEAGQVVSQARAVHPGLRIVARAHSDAEVEHLTGLGADVVIMGEREIARGMIDYIARKPEPAPDEVPPGVA
jgi:CPA2 family monovalent cation:H+ antiporter-2